MKPHTSTSDLSSSDRGRAAPSSLALPFSDKTRAGRLSDTPMPWLHRSPQPHQSASARFSSQSYSDPSASYGGRAARSPPPNSQGKSCGSAVVPGGGQVRRAMTGVQDPSSPSGETFNQTHLPNNRPGVNRFSSAAGLCEPVLGMRCRSPTRDISPGPESCVRRFASPVRAINGETNQSASYVAPPLAAQTLPTFGRTSPSTTSPAAPTNFGSYVANPHTQSSSHTSKLGPAGGPSVSHPPCMGSYVAPPAAASAVGSYVPMPARGPNLRCTSPGRAIFAPSLPHSLTLPGAERGNTASQSLVPGVRSSNPSYVAPPLSSSSTSASVGASFVATAPQGSIRCTSPPAALHRPSQTQAPIGRHDVGSLRCTSPDARQCHSNAELTRRPLLPANRTMATSMSLGAPSNMTLGGYPGTTTAFAGCGYRVASPSGHSFGRP